MGLFAQNSDVGLESAIKILGEAIELFNRVVGQSYLIEAEFCATSLSECCKKFDELAKDGFPPDPGPFKRMAGFAVLAQLLPLFKFQSVSSSEKSPLSDDDHLIWRPRIAVWCLPYFAAALRIDGKDGILEAFELPTPHFQVEFIALLRNFAHGMPASGEWPETALLLERCVTVGLILEASAYASHNRTETAELQKGAAACIEKIKNDEFFQDDMIFNDFEVLHCAYDLGVD